MRLFAAIDPPSSATADLARAVEALAGEDDPRVAALRWTRPDQWHVTLGFFGEVAEPYVDELALRLGRAAARTPPMALRLDGVGCFPRNPRAAKVVWLGLAGDVEPLRRLAERCAAAARRTGIEVGRQRFTPHLTIARSRPSGGTDAQRVLGWLGTFATGSWRAETLRLVHSTLGATVTHETLAEWPLGEA
jgi:2'-5' RNA ligase